MNRDLVVVDASLVVKWVVEEPYTPEAEDLLNEWKDRAVRMISPGLLPYEISNALYKRARRNELSLDEAKEGVRAALDAGPVLLDHTALHARALELAAQHGRPASYDAHYLALAESNGCECWTADERLYNAVKDQLSWGRWVGELCLQA